MSNPAVIKLQSGNIKRSRVWLDDNFGESIHIHIDDHRVDLTVAEFGQLYEDLCISLNEMFPIEGLDFSKIDPVFLSVWLWPHLPAITHVKFDKVFLEDLWAPHQSGRYKLSESVGVKALKGLSDANEGFRLSHHIGQSDNQRLAESLESIKRHGYPYEDKYIIIYGDSNIIFDGQHRASCLYYLYGNVEVPVMRIYSSKFPVFKKVKNRVWRNWKLYHWYKDCHNSLTEFVEWSAKVYDYLKAKIRKYIKQHRHVKTPPVDSYIENIFLSR